MKSLAKNRKELLAATPSLAEMAGPALSAHTFSDEHKLIGIEVCIFMVLGSCGRCERSRWWDRVGHVNVHRCLRRGWGVDVHSGGVVHEV